MSEELVCTIDLAASLAALAEQPLPNDACLDSFNVLGALLGEDGRQRARSTLSSRTTATTEPSLCVRDHGSCTDYKKKTARNVVVETQLANTKVPEFQLFNLDERSSGKDERHR